MKYLKNTGLKTMGLAHAVQNQKTADLTELVGTQLFKQVSMAQVAGLLRYCPTLTLTSGDLLIVPGQTIDKVHLLLQGRLQVLDGEPNGKPVGHILQGECVGLSSFIDRQPCHVSIVSEGISRLLVLDEERLMALINTPTAISRNLLFLLMTYLRSRAARAPEPVATPVEPANTHNHIDAVTGLFNQVWLEDTLDRLIMRAATDSAPLSLLAVDLLDLSGLTEQYGQELLDLSLREISKTLSTSMRPTDMIARHSSGKFVVMLPGSDLENAEMVEARIQEILDNTEIVIPGVCVLPPMKVVLGRNRMKAFISSRKLVDDAFASLEQNRSTILAAMAESEKETEDTEKTAETIESIEAVPELHAPVAAVSGIDELEPQALQLQIEPLPVVSEAASQVMSEILLNDAHPSLGNTSLGFVPEPLPDAMPTNDNTVTADAGADKTSHHSC